MCEEGAECGVQQESPSAPAALGSAHSSATPLVWIKDLRFRKEPQPLTPRLARGRAEWPLAWLPAGWVSACPAGQDAPWGPGDLSRGAVAAVCLLIVQRQF